MRKYMFVPQKKFQHFLESKQKHEFFLFKLKRFFSSEKTKNSGIEKSYFKIWKVDDNNWVSQQL